MFIPAPIMQRSSTKSREYDQSSESWKRGDVASKHQGMAGGLEELGLRLSFPLFPQRSRHDRCTSGGFGFVSSPEYLGEATTWRAAECNFRRRFNLNPLELVLSAFTPSEESETSINLRKATNLWLLLTRFKERKYRERLHARAEERERLHGTESPKLPVTTPYALLLVFFWSWSCLRSARRAHGLHVKTQTKNRRRSARAWPPRL
jgi:hypothetical protein